MALVAGLAIGIIPAEAAFDGFKNDVTVIIACALIVSAAFARSGVIELAMRRVMPLLKTERSQVPVLTGAVTLLSMATKNVGALAIMMPVALQVARQTKSSPSRLLMPMAFGAMAGGMVTLVGTAPNIIVAEPTGQIGTGVASDMDYVAAAIRAVKDVDPDIFVLQGAGISNGEDVFRVIRAGAEATGSSSGVVKAKDRAAMVDEMISAVRRAWDERIAKDK